MAGPRCYAILMIAVCCYLVTVEAQQTDCVADIVFVLDSSGSIVVNGMDDWEMMKSFVVDVVNMFTVSPTKVQVGLVVYGTNAFNRFFLDDFNNANSITGNISAQEHLGGDQKTNTPEGIMRMRTEQFLTQNGDRSNARNVGIIITDGKSTREQEGDLFNDTLNEAKLARDDGIVLFAVGVGDGVNLDELRGISSDPMELGTIYFQSVDFNDLTNLVSVIAEQVCMEVEPQTTTTTPIPPIDTIPCNRDVVFVLDSSEPVLNSNFEMVTFFVQQVVNLLQIPPSRVGVVRYGTTAENMFFLISYADSKQDTYRAVGDIAFLRSQSADMAGAIRLLYDDQFKEGNGDNSEKGNVAVVIAGFRSNNQSETLNRATTAKNGGIDIVSIGFGSSIDENEMRDISSSPSAVNQDYYIFDDSTMLNGDFARTIANRICAGDEVTPSITSGTTPATVVTTPTRSPDCMLTCAVDLVFVIDGSESIGMEDFQNMLSFMQNVVSSLPIANNMVMVGVVQFGLSWDTRNEFYLTNFTTAEETNAAIGNIEYLNSLTYTDVGLALMIDYQFSSTFAVRDVSKMAIVITDGQSQRPDMTLMEAERAIENDIDIVAIGVGDKIDANEISGISNADHVENVNWFRVADFISFEPVIQALTDRICTCEASTPSQEIPAPQVTCTTDLVFVIDGSDSIGVDNFQNMLSFMQNIVSRLPIASNMVTVGVVQFGLSWDTQHVFYLTNYTTVEDTNAAIGNIEYLDSGSYTDVGLTLMIDYQFSSTYSVRNVKKTAIVITDGPSERPDLTLMEAERAIENDIDIIAIGVGNQIDVNEISGISNADRVENVNWFRVADFASFDPIVQAVIDRICACDMSTPAQEIPSPGPQGVQGDTGQTGPQGSIGATGATGPVGATGGPGATGASGLQGVQGAPGSPGIKGSRGEIGSTGPSGPQGQVGSTGLPGIRGEQGFTGASGAPGTGTMGWTGASGPPGQKGAKGEIGLSGPSGPLGPKGEKGQTGGNGATGPAGPQGQPGPQGIMGNLGATGRQGDTGRPGPTGESGVTGATGPTGERGDRGFTGVQGPKGDRGDQGLMGVQGATGSLGHTGATGPQGRIGDTGLTGPAGSDGSKGDKGNQGTTGPQGVKGERGDQGIPGQQGQQGATGPAGPRGNVGQMGQPGVKGEVGMTGGPGNPGPAGPQGIKGEPGSNGVNGANGQKGSNGATGQQGIQGAPGVAGPIGQRGEQGSTGPAGEKGDKGQKGNTGIQGNPGNQGATGPAGPRGNDGNPGPQGPSGNDGAKGNKGEIGFTGASGPKGDRGNDGWTGATGGPGAQGPPGPQGNPGNPGPQGPSGGPGATGRQGNPGPQGQQGSPGQQGQKGEIGSTGPAGQRGQQGIAGLNGSPGPIGPQGNNGAKGDKGEIGLRGATGPSGGQGPAGQKGEIGSTGAPGSGQKGDRGDPGPSGNVGAPGSTGPQGIQGLKGEPGDSPVSNITTCAGVDECSELNGGCSHYCVDTYDSYYCTCPKGYGIGPVPIMCGDVVCSNLDIVFVIDSSESLQKGWSDLVTFVADIAYGLNVTSDGSQNRVGVVYYATTAMNLFYLNTFQSKNDLRSAILGTPYLGGTTRTDLGLAELLNTQFTTNRGDRPDADNLAIIITDGCSTDPDETLRVAEQVKSANIQIISLGLSSAVSLEELRGISSTPQLLNQNYFLASATSADLVNQVISRSCRNTNEESSSCGAVDLAIVLDSSGSVSDQDGWNSILLFLTNFLELLDIGPDGTRVALVLYASNADVQFYLNDILTKDGVLARISQLQPFETLTRTDEGIRLMSEQVFQTDRGDRTDIPNVAVVLTDGESNDMALTLQRANDAKAAGVMIFAIGVGDANPDELRAISSEPQLENTNYFSTPTFDTLQTLTQQVQQGVCSSVGVSNVYCNYISEDVGLMCFCKEDVCISKPVNSSQCYDINECSYQNGGCEQLCTNSEGSYTCSCTGDYFLANDQKSCRPNPGNFLAQTGNEASSANEENAGFTSSMGLGSMALGIGMGFITAMLICTIVVLLLKQRKSNRPINEPQARPPGSISAPSFLTLDSSLSGNNGLVDDDNSSLGSIATLQ